MVTKIQEKNSEAIIKMWWENANEGGPWKNDEDFEHALQNSRI